MGAVVLAAPNVTVTPPRVVGSGPTILSAVTNPVTFVRNPEPLMVAIPPGEMPVPLLKLAPFTMVIFCGPGNSAVRVKVAVKVDDVALTVIVPGVPPAVTVVEACPFEPVTTEEALKRAVPDVTWKFTCAPWTPWPLEFTTSTVKGNGKAVSSAMDC